MNPMMATIGLNYVFIALWGLHVLSVIAFFTGVLFLIALAIKTFDATQLKSWAIWLLGLGTIVCLFTVAVVGRPWIGMWYWGSGMQDMRMMRMDQMMDRMMEEMQEHDAGGNDPAHTRVEDMMRQFRQGGRQGDLLTE